MLTVTVLQYIKLTVFTCHDGLISTYCAVMH
jgi:hypothetical protein